MSPRLLVFLLGATLIGQSYAVAQSFGLTAGAAKLESAGALAFGPPGILFVGDSTAGAVFALDTRDRTARTEGPEIAITGIDQKIAAMLGTTPSDIRFHDVKVNPVSKNIYLAVSRGRGPDAIPVLLRIEASAAPTEPTITELRTDNIPHARVALPGLPNAPKGPRRRTSRELVITDLQYSDGELVIAGLSNEDFSSTLRVVPFPFPKAERGASIGTSVEIYHTSHFTYETDSPVRTMVPYTVGGERYLLAAYTCTPLVKLRMSDLKAGAHVTGETLAELGRHSSPLDMILYKKEGHDFLLVANTARGVLKLSIDHLERFAPVNEDGGNPAQIAMQRVVGLKGVVQLDAYDATRAIMLLDSRDGLDLKLVALP